MAENQGFTFDEWDLSQKHNGNMDPLTWLQETWQELIGKFVSIAGQSADEPVFGDVSTKFAQQLDLCSPYFLLIGLLSSLFEKLLSLISNSFR